MAKFRKSINKNGGVATRGVIQVDIESNSEEALLAMESYIVEELNIEPSCHADETEYGILYSMFYPTHMTKEFNQTYKEAKEKFKNM